MQRACNDGNLQMVKETLHDVQDKGAIKFADGTNPLYRWVDTLSYLLIVLLNLYNICMIMCR